MKRSGDRVIGRSGDRKALLATQLTDSLMLRLAAIYKTFFAVMREIFDEGAYERFLSRVKSERTIESYREFMRDRESVTGRKPRCC